MTQGEGPCHRGRARQQSSYVNVMKHFVVILLSFAKKEKNSMFSAFVSYSYLYSCNFMTSDL